MNTFYRSPQKIKENNINPDISNNDPYKGVNVGMATGKLFESQMLGDLNSKRILESFQQTLNETLQNAGIGEKELNEAVTYILFRDGVNKGSRKWKSLEVFMQSAFGSLKSGNEKEKAEAYYDFNELLRTINNKKVFPCTQNVPTLLSRDIESNMSLEIARISQPEIVSQKFGTTILNELHKKLPETKFKLINGVGTPMDYLQKIDFVIAVMNTNGRIVRYYSYDLKTDPGVKDSLMSDVLIITPEDLQATLEERTKNCFI